MKLLVIADAHLITRSGKKVAYAPYVVEMDMWMRHVHDVTFISPGTIKGKLLGKAFLRQDFRHISVRRLEFNKFLIALISLVTIPYQALILWNQMRRADHIHMRSPGNLTLLAGIVAMTLPRKRKTIKYAGNFNPTASQPLSYKLQKALFTNTRLSKNTTIMAYGNWPNQSRNVAPFFTATYSELDKVSIDKNISKPLQIMFVGTLTKNKNPQVLMRLVQELNKQGIAAQAHFYGDGPMMEALQVQSSELDESSYELGVQSSEYDETSSKFEEATDETAFKSSSPSGRLGWEATSSDLEASRSEFRVQSSELEETSLDSDKIPLKNSFPSGRLGWDKTNSESSNQQLAIGNKKIVNFHGNQPAAVVKEAYKRSHFLLLASQSEGWPKVVAEAMWHGCIPIATPVSCVPWMLGVSSSELDESSYELGAQSSENNETSSKFEEATDGTLLKSSFPSGRLGWEETSSKFEALTDGAPLKSAFPSGRLGWEETSSSFIGSRGVLYNSIPQVIEVLQHLLENPTQFLDMSQAAQEWSQQYTLERFESEIVKLLQS